MAEKRTPKKAPRKPPRGKGRGGPKIIPPQKILFYHPETGEEFEAVIEIKPKIIHPPRP